MSEWGEPPQAVRITARIRCPQCLWTVMAKAGLQLSQLGEVYSASRFVKTTFKSGFPLLPGQFPGQAHISVKDTGPGSAAVGLLQTQYRSCSEFA